MPKRQKAKVVTTPRIKEDKPVSLKHQKQLEREAFNKMRGFKPWNNVKIARHAKRKAAGKTYENWRKTHSARSIDSDRPNVNNTKV